ncbi:MAG: TIGR00730 family Rossman fold protein [Oscillospiraceae bacterium]|nr:TIGR00730 family Rossman fold protein [Oscillospiraceae bacterium]
MKICVYGAASDNIDSAFVAEAEKLGRLIAANGHTLVFGGGATGVMGACARGVKEKNGKSIGVAPKFFDEPGVLCKDCTEFLFTETMRERKQLMEDLADAFVVAPGGIGTYEEFIEILTLKQLGRHAKPIAMLNTCGYYEPMNALMKNTVEKGFMKAECLALYKSIDTADGVLSYVEEELGAR